MALSPIITSSTLAKDEIIRPKYLAKRTCSDRVHCSWFEIHQDCPWNKLVVANLLVIHLCKGIQFCNRRNFKSSHHYPPQGVLVEDQTLHCRLHLAVSRAHQRLPPRTWLQFDCHIGQLGYELFPWACYYFIKLPGVMNV